MNHLCGADQAKREPRRDLVEDAPDVIRDGFLAEALAFRVVERAIPGVQLRNGVLAPTRIPLAEDLRHVSLHESSEHRRRAAGHDVLLSKEVALSTNWDRRVM